MGSGQSSLPVTSIVMDLDSTQIGSYSGAGTTWSNIVAAPADGATQTAYDFYLGNDSGAGGATDPVFTGSAGTSGAYWAVNGSQYFNLKSGSNPTLFSKMHKTTGGSPFWIAMAFKTHSSVGTGFSAFVTESSSGSPDNGVVLQMTSSKPNFHINDSQSGAVTSTFVNSTDTIWIASVDPSLTTNNVRFWVNSRTKEQISKTFTANTNAADFPAGLLSNQGSNIIPNGARVRHFSCGNALIDDADAVVIINALNIRHGITYV